MVRGKLDETDTRYWHWAELRDIFLEGVQAVNNMSPSFVSDKDRLRQTNLQIAADLIAKQIEIFGDHEHVKWDTERQVRAIPKPKPHQDGTVKDRNSTS